MKKHLWSLVLALGLLPGCVTYLIADDVKAEREASRRDYYFTNYAKRVVAAKDAGACSVAVDAFQDFFGEKDTSSLSSEEKKVLAERIRDSATTLKTACVEGEAARLQSERRWARLTRLFRDLATLPLPDEERAALALRADTTELLRADALVEDGEKAWAEGRVYDALASFASAERTASSVQAATAEQKAKYAELHVAKKRAHVDDMLQKAGQAARSPDTAHLAALYLARAFEVSQDKAIGRRLEALRAELLASHVYQWQVEWKGEPRITKAAKELVNRHTFNGNLKGNTGREFAAVVDVGAFTVTPSETAASRSGQYKTGERSVDNPAYRELQAFIMRQQTCLAGLGSVNWKSAWTSGQKELGCAVHTAHYESSRERNQDELKRAQKQLKNTPMVLQEDVMSSLSYDTREWRQVIAAPVQLRVKHALEAAPTSSTMTLQDEYTDHAHAPVPKLGLGNKQLAKMSDNELAASAGAKLGAKVIAEIEQDYQAWLVATPKLGDRGAVLFLLLGGKGHGVDVPLEQKTGVRSASALLRAR
jgi:hypothetical protein